MITLDLDNRYVTIKGADRNTIRALEKVTSYYVAGYMFSPAFRQRRWDGREHLLSYHDKHGYRVPIGLAADVERALDGMGAKWKRDETRARKPGARIEFRWNDAVVHRPYQVGVINVMTDPDDPHRGRGIVKMPIRSGKTKTGAGIIHRLGARTLFIVPSQMLLHQTIASLGECFPDIAIGRIGDSIWEEGREITVATIQTLARARGGTRECGGTGEDAQITCECGKKRCRGGRPYKTPTDPRFAALRTSYGLVMFDEVHHLTGDSWHKALMDIESYYRIGLSATVYLDNDRENERGVIWLKACCGDLKVDISTSQLIRDGYLMKPTIHLYKISEPDLRSYGWSKRMTSMGITENQHRNTLICNLVKTNVEAGLKVLVVTRLHGQTALLYDQLEAMGVKVATIIGNDRTAERDTKVSAFKRGLLQALVGTVLGEGVDIPEIECVINAEGGRDVKATVQRMRNLTPSPGKTTALFIDFVDMTNGYLAEHSKERLKAYRSESEFDVKLVSDAGS